MTVTRGVAEFIVAFELQTVPKRVIESAKAAIGDCIGVALAGTVEPCAEITRALLRETGSGKEATIIGSHVRASVPDAAFVNGIAAHALDYDDWYGRPGYYLGHPSVCLVPVILALGERLHTSGARALEAYITGFEVGAKVGVATSNEPYRRGWHTTGTLGVIRATIAAAKMLGLNIGQIQQALGIAASQASGLRGNLGTMTKPFHAGHAARCGIIAAMLGQLGFSANDGILEDAYGFCTTFGGPDACDLSGLVDSLGRPWELETPGVNLKKYPSCGGTHAGIDAALELADEESFRRDAITSITCELAEDVSQVLVHSRPQSGLEGKFSIEYCLAAALLDGEVTLRQFSDEMVRRPEIKRLINLVRLQRVPAVSGNEKDLTTTVTIQLNDGRSFLRRVTIPQGDARRPLRQDEQYGKYVRCAERVLSPWQIEHSFALISRLEQLDDICELTRGLVSESDRC